MNKIKNTELARPAFTEGTIDIENGYRIPNVRLFEYSYEADGIDFSQEGLEFWEGSYPKVPYHENEDGEFEYHTENVRKNSDSVEECIDDLEDEASGNRLSIGNRMRKAAKELRRELQLAEKWLKDNQEAIEFIGAQPSQMSAYEKSLLSELRSHWIDRLTPELCPEGMDDEWNEDGLMTKIWRFFWDAGSTTIEECSDLRSEFDPNGYHTLEALIFGLEGDVMNRVENLRGTDGALELFQNIQELQDTYSSWVGAWEEKWDTLSENEKDEWRSWSREDHAEIMEGIDVTFGRSFKREPQVAA